MSCPDWQALSEGRAADRDDSPEWLQALEHLDGCAACRAGAPAFEPTLVFRRLSAPALDLDGIEAMKRAVSSMRRGETIEHRRRFAALAPLWGDLPRVWLRAAALAAVVLGSLLLRGAGRLPEASAPSPAALPAAAAHEIDLRRLPLVETADPTYGAIIQVVDDDISVVLVVPSEMDV